MPGGGVSVRPSRIFFCLWGLALAASLATASDGRLLQPVDDSAGWVLRVEAGRLTTERGAGRAATRLRRGESLEFVTETAGGWIAAGGRETGDGGRRLVLLSSDGASVARLAPPATSATSIALRPVPLVDRGRLAALAWLEGDEPRRLAVRAAFREGDGWSRPLTVAGPAEGSQTALSGAVLEDGSMLLVWSAFDGQDDEIHWSLFRGGAWTPARRLHAANDFPDITPSLVADGAGALVAWSRREEEEYTSVIARFDGERWSTERPIAGPGAVFPTFHRESARLHLVLRSAQPRGWAVLEVSSDGRAERRAVFATAVAERPAIGTDSGRELTLSWPGDSARETARWERTR